MIKCSTVDGSYVMGQIGNWKFTANFHADFKREPDNNILVTLGFIPLEFCRPVIHIQTIQYHQGMTPIAKIKIAFPIPIFLRNCDRDRDPDRNFKNMCDPIAIAGMRSRDLLRDLFTNKITF